MTGFIISMFLSYTFNDPMILDLSNKNIIKS